MGLRREIFQQKAEQELDVQLETAVGRDAWWSTLLGNAQQDSMVALMETTVHLAGEIIECGVYRGSSLFRLCRALHDTGVSKKVIACDSFEGFPADAVTTSDTTMFRTTGKLRTKFRIASDVPDRIIRFAENFEIPIQVCRGRFEQTLPALLEDENLRFCFVHLDVDLYASYKFCLESIYERVVDGGIVVFDDYESRRWPGARKAVDEFFRNRNEELEKTSVRSKSACYVRKLPSSKKGTGVDLT